MSIIDLMATLFVVKPKLSNKDRSFLDLALKVSLLSSAKDKHGAVLVKGGRVLAVGTNIPRNEPLCLSEEHMYNISVHAEEAVLRQVKNSTGCVLYVARSNRAGNPMLSKPCDRCYGILVRSGVKKVFHT